MLGVTLSESKEAMLTREQSTEENINVRKKKWKFTPACGVVNEPETGEQLGQWSVFQETGLDEREGD